MTRAELFLDLCKISGVAPDDVLAHDGNSIGAQYFVRDAGADFWFDVERTSVLAYHHMRDTAGLYHPPGHQYPIQAWCAEMYMQQFATIKAGFTPRATPLMDFSWANAPAAHWDAKPYFHDAGHRRRTAATSARSPGSRRRSARRSRSRRSRPPGSTCS